MKEQMHNSKYLAGDDHDYARYKREEAKWEEWGFHTETVQQGGVLILFAYRLWDENGQNPSPRFR